MLTDNEIIKALECCGKIVRKCCWCPLWNRAYCDVALIELSYDLINRQKAEIERLNNHIADVSKKVKADAIKEFAERLKEKVGLPKDTILGTMVYADEIDNLVKEMVGG